MAINTNKKYVKFDFKSGESPRPDSSTERDGINVFTDANAALMGHDVDGNMYGIGGSLPINNQTASYTLVRNDAGKYVRMNLSVDGNLTVPPHSSVAYKIGTQIVVRAVGAGQVTIVEGSGVTVNPPESGTLALTGQGSTVTLIKVDTNEWDLTGDVEAA